MPKTVADFFKRSDVRSKLKRWKPYVVLALYLFLLGYGLLRLLESAADGYIRAPRKGGHAWPSEGVYWFYGAVYLGMVLVAIWALADTWRKMKKGGLD